MRERREALGYSFQDLADRTWMSKSTLQRYETGAIKNIPIARLRDLSIALSLGPNELIGIESDWTMSSSLRSVHKVNYIPRIGRIACGTPLFAEQNIQEYVLLPEGVKADFVLDCVGDSIIDASIDDGDTVFIREQPEVENGEIAAVLIGDKATLKRVYHNGTILTLMPANHNYAPYSYTADELECVRIIGKATAVLKML